MAIREVGSSARGMGGTGSSVQELATHKSYRSLSIPYFFILL